MFCCPDILLYVLFIRTLTSSDYGKKIFFSSDLKRYFLTLSKRNLIQEDIFLWLAIYFHLFLFTGFEKSRLLTSQRKIKHVLLANLLIPLGKEREWRHTSSSPGWRMKRVSFDKYTDSFDSPSDVKNWTSLCLPKRRLERMCSSSCAHPCYQLCNRDA